MSIDVNKEDLRRLAPDAREEAINAIVEARALLDELDITDVPARWHAFVAQIAHESGGFRVKEENLYYSAQRLTQVWPRRFPTVALARPYAKNPEALANFTYDDANRGPKHKLGNTQPGDGWRFRGRGFIQITGRSEYTRVSKLINIDLVNNPELAADPKIGIAIAAHLFVDKGCRELADKGDFVGITKRINGGTIGLADRIAYHIKAKRIFKEAPPREPEKRSPTVPNVAEREPPNSMVTSTTGGAAIANGGLAGLPISQGIADAVAKTNADGVFSLQELAMNVLASGWFWTGMIMLVCSVYIWIERRKKLVTWGV